MVFSEYHLAHDIRDTIAVMEKEQGGARIMAGGTDLMLQQHQGRAEGEYPCGYYPHSGAGPE